MISRKSTTKNKKGYNILQKAERVFINGDPFEESFSSQEIGKIGDWSAWWMNFPESASLQSVVYFKLPFNFDTDAKIRIHISADERYKFFLDGELISLGPSRGDQDNWYYKTYDIDFKKGEHVFVAQVWRLAKLSPFAQVSVAPGFLLAAEGQAAEMFNTGLAPWEVKIAGGYSFRENEICFGPCHDTIIHGEDYDWNWKKGVGERWEPAQKALIARSGLYYSNYEISGHHLVPDPLPDMLNIELFTGKVRHVDLLNTVETWKAEISAENNQTELAEQWQDVINNNGNVEIEPHKTVRVIIDLENYYCAYPVIATCGGENSLIRISWSEALFEQSRYDHINNPKGNRDVIEGKYFVAVGDDFYPDGSSDGVFEPLWWRAGRYIEILVKSADQPVTIKNFKLLETRYPYEMESQFESEDERIKEIIPIMVRAMQMCSHETLMDCPYYEQLMYAGDTRLELLTIYSTTGDDRLARKAIKMFDASIVSSGFTSSQYPSRVQQVIPPFSLWWIGMVHDYALWRGDKNFIASFRPKIHCVLDTFNLHIDSNEHLLVAPNGWNFVDWVSSWNYGTPPQAMPGEISSIMNLQLVLGLEYASQIERWCGDSILADYYNAKAVNLLDNVIKRFWCKDNNLLADDLAKSSFSEHAQILAVLSRNISTDMAEQIGASLFGRDDLAKASIYFTHYYLEVCHKLKNSEAFFKRLELWFSLKENGFKTTFEEPDNSRSDCHAWGAHPIYHLFATLLGIRPTEFGFEKHEIDPMPIKNMNISALLPLPYGKYLKVVYDSGVIEESAHFYCM